MSLKLPKLLNKLVVKLTLKLPRGAFYVIIHTSTQGAIFNMEKIIFPIGDWSFDGHAFLANFLVESNWDVQSVREIHFLENDFFANLCVNYGDNEVDLVELYSFVQKYSKTPVKFFGNILSKLMEHVQFDILNSPNLNETEFFNFLLNETEKNYKEGLVEEILIDMSCSNGEAMVILWTELLMLIEKAQEGHNPNNSLSLVVSSQPMGYGDDVSKDIPTINFYGFDKNNRRLHTPGYGIWSCDEMDFFYPVN